jgi:hypothetical protein
MTDRPALESTQHYDFLFPPTPPEPEIECEKCGGVDRHQCRVCETKITGKECRETGMCVLCRYDEEVKNGKEKKMGEQADLILNGDCCEVCGENFVDEGEGYPRRCKNCGGDGETI